MPGIYLMLFEVDLQFKYVCGFILGMWSIAYRFERTVTLTSGICSRIIMFAAYLLLFVVEILNFVCGCILGSPTILGSL